MRKATCYRLRSQWETIAPGLRAIEIGTHACGDAAVRGTLVESFSEGQTALRFLPWTLEQIAEQHTVDVCEDGDPPCGSDDCERKHSEAAGGGAQVPGAATPGAGPGGDPDVRSADPSPDLVMTPAAAPAGSELAPCSECGDEPAAAAEVKRHRAAIACRLREIAGLISPTTRIEWSRRRTEGLVDRMVYWADEIEAGTFGVPSPARTGEAER